MNEPIQSEAEANAAGLLTKRDFMVACQALAETHNRYLESFQAEEELDDYSREEMEHAIQNTHMTFMKFQAILESTEPPVEEADADEDAQTQDLPEAE